MRNFRQNCFASLATAGLLLANPAVAATPDAQSRFDAANKLYEERKFAEAAGMYEQMLQSGSGSAAVYFNLGNALFKSGQMGQAIVAYRAAEVLTPRDPDVQANLRFARNQVQGPTLRPGRWERWIGTLSLNEWAMLAAGAFWVTLGLLGIMQMRPQSARALRGGAAAGAGVTLVLGGCLLLALATRPANRLAVVTARDVVVHNGPLESSQTAFTVTDGAELRVLDRKDDWLQVTDGTRRVGWLKRREARLLADS